MPSQFWFMSPQDGYDAAYQYESQRRFLDEADKLLARLMAAYQTNDMRFHTDDESVEKAVWMLHMDALDALQECLSLLRENRHTVAGRLFRDVVETLDRAWYFHTRTQRSTNDLSKWYRDEVVPHRRVREQVGKLHGEEARGAKSREYDSLSKFTHRTYRVLKDAYCLGAGDKLWFDWRLRKHPGVPSIPQTVGQYLALAARIARRLVEEATVCNVVPQAELRKSLDGTVIADIFTHQKE